MSEATQVVHWPGKDVLACDSHAKKLFGLAEILGFVVSATTPLQFTYQTSTFVPVAPGTATSVTAIITPSAPPPPAIPTPNSINFQQTT